MDDPAAKMEPEMKKREALQLLVGTLEHLKEEDLKSFIFHLREFKMSPYGSIAQSRLEVKNRLDLADVMLSHYGADVLQATLQILPMIPRQDLIADLETKIGAVTLDTPTGEPANTTGEPANTLRDTLLDTLHQLSTKDFLTFQKRLSWPPHVLPCSSLDGADRITTVNIMIEKFLPSGAKKVTIDILKSMNLNNLAVGLESAE